MAPFERPYSFSSSGTSKTGAEALPCVLLVEDDLAARWLMRSALKGRCDFISASNGEQALKAYRRHHPAVVVLDYRLPLQTGDAVLDALLEEDPDACVIVMSGKENMSALKKMIATGARGMLIKPFGKQEFLNLVLGGEMTGTFSDAFLNKGD